MKVITWVDLQGRYMVTQPAYNDSTCPPGETEEECIARTWAKIIAVGPYGIPIDHPHFLVENDLQLARVDSLSGLYFRYGVFMLPNREGVLDDRGKIKLTRDARDGAWEMDTDGRPKVNIIKARGVQMDYIRVARNKKLAETDTPFRLAYERWILEESPAAKAALLQLMGESQALRDIPGTFDLSTYTTPEELKAAWPVDLPRMV